MSSKRKGPPDYTGRINSLRSGILGSGLDEQTKQELLGQFSQVSAAQNRQTSSGFGSIADLGGVLQNVEKELGTAREGTSAKYKSRLATQKMFESLIDRPDAKRLRGGILDMGSSLRK